MTEETLKLFNLEEKVDAHRQRRWVGGWGVRPQFLVVKGMSSPSPSLGGLGLWNQSLVYWWGEGFGILSCAPRCYDNGGPCDPEIVSSKTCAGSGDADLAEGGVDTTLLGGGPCDRRPHAYSTVSVHPMLGIIMHP